MALFVIGLITGEADTVMPDVLLVFARADAARAQSLADMLEAAGLSVGGAPSDAADARTAGAAIVLWSDAAAKSSVFLECTRDVVAAGRAVFASLAPTTPAIICNANPFDLSRWEGDPDDPLLDPLFAAVQRRIAGAQDFVSLYLRRYREMHALAAADEEVPEQLTLWTPAPTAPPPVARIAAAALPRPPRNVTRIAARRAAIAATVRRTAVGAIAATAALCVMFISGGANETSAQVSAATAAPVGLVVQVDDGASPIAANEPIKLVDLEPVSHVAPARMPPASAPQSMIAPRAAEEEAFFSARRAYRAQCSRFETAAFCTCVTAGLAQEVTDADLRAAQTGLGERLAAQAGAPADASAPLQAEGRYMDACTQFRRKLHG